MCGHQQQSMHAVGTIGNEWTPCQQSKNSNSAIKWLSGYSLSLRACDLYIPEDGCRPVSDVYRACNCKQKAPQRSVCMANVTRARFGYQPGALLSNTMKAILLLTSCPGRAICTRQDAALVPQALMCHEHPKVEPEIADNV